MGLMGGMEAGGETAHSVAGGVKTAQSWGHDIGHDSESAFSVLGLCYE